jgi:HPt (histidine-containing phosphotransfer) domain-containing protein
LGENHTKAHDAALMTANPGPSAAPRAADLDAGALANLRALDPTGAARLVQRVVGAFETSASRLLPQLESAHACAQWDGVRHVAHTLKSSSASVGAFALSKVCAEVEALVRDGRGDELGGRVELLVDEVHAVLAALRALPDSGA